MMLLAERNQDDFCPFCEQLGESCEECRIAVLEKYADEAVQDEKEGK